ncbi:MAG: 2-C-methyl-D-erythritol 2,4-cyclodiphosphate synthase [bacterium]|nr:2-C-methyl-D-erythritol 2,4-cyclodiphosphate synthase [bacterium]
MRIGIGYDAHRLVENRKLILGGIEIPYIKGLLGHSDADVLTHAVIDALLGAINYGSIGDLFPDTDAKYKNISSLVLLEKVVEMLEDRQYSIINIDSVIIAQEPKLKPYIYAIRKSLADSLKISESQVSVKATTTEKMGFEGRKEGISTQSIVLLSCS